MASVGNLSQVQRQNTSKQLLQNAALFGAVPLSKSLEIFIARLPKAETHLHIEGTLEPALMLKLAHRNKVDIPYKDVAEIKAKYQFESLASFLEIYFQGSGVLCTEADFYDLMIAYLRRAAADNIRYTEVSFDPQTHSKRGVKFSTVLQGLLRAAEDAEEKLGVKAKLVPCVLRDLSLESAMEMLPDIVKHKDQIIAVGLSSNEKDNPPEKFRDFFQRIKEEGINVTAHAGEEGPPQHVWKSLQDIGASRIDHGNAIVRDDALFEHVATSKIPVTQAPVSNLKLAGIERLSDSPLKRMLEKGVVVSVNSDDPAYFGGYLGDVFAAVACHLQLNKEDVVQLVRNSFMGTFLSDAEKQRYLAEVDACQESIGDESKLSASMGGYTDIDVQ